MILAGEYLVDETVVADCRNAIARVRDEGGRKRLQLEEWRLVRLQAMGVSEQETQAGPESSPRGWPLTSVAQ